MAATLVSSTPSSVYPNSGKNFAPVAGFKALDKPESNPSKLCDALRKKYESYKERDYDAWIEILNIGQMVANLTNGKLLMLRHALNNQYMFVKRDGRFSDNKTVGGLFQFYMTKLDAEWLSSRPERDPIVPSDNDQIEEFMSAVKVVQDYYDRRFFDDQYELKESDSAKCYGTWVTRYRFDPEIKDIVCELLPFPACRWDIRFRAEESAYFIYESKCSTAILEHLLDADLPEDGGSNDSYGLQLIEQIAKQGGNVQGQGKADPYGTYNEVSDETTVVEMWLQPAAYCEIELDDDEETLAGVSLKEGRTLLDTFPKGMCVVGINNMKTIIGIYDENHKDHIVSGIYHLQSFSGVGKGVSDAVDTKKDLDDLYSQLLRHAKSHGTPAWGYNKNMVSEQDARSIGKPGKNIPFDFDNAPDGVKSINEAVQALVPGNASQGIWEMAERMKENLQMAFQVTTFSDGMPGVDNKTATGAQIGEANAKTLLVPQHRNKADHRKRSDKVIYNLFRRFCNKPKFFASRTKNGITAGQYISGDEFADVDIDFAIVADSEIPQTPLKKQMGTSALLQQSGGLMGLIQAIQLNPQLTGEVATTFGASLTIPKQTDIARVCRKRIEQSKKMLQGELQSQQIMSASTGIPFDNANIASDIVDRLMPPISTKEPHVMEKISWLAELLDADEMQFAPMELRYVIEEMIGRHIEASTLGEAQIEQDRNLAMIMANLPSILGERMMTKESQTMQQQFAQEQADQQEAQRQQQVAEQLQLKQAEADISLRQAEADHSRASAIQDKSHRNALQLKAIDSLARMDADKQKARKSKAAA